MMVKQAEIVTRVTAKSLRQSAFYARNSCMEFYAIPLAATAHFLPGIERRQIALDSRANLRYT